MQKNTLILFLMFAGLYLALAILGGIYYYSPVPYFDMWDGYINFYILASSGDLSAWWSQHNEHRIVLARMLFWLDLNLFKGQSIFLIIVNYLLAGLSFLLIYKILQKRLPQTQDEFTKHIIGLVIFCLLFSWLQWANFTWAFQNQFFLAQLIPLAAFFLLSKHFICACLLGIIAIGTMANGVLTLPLMFMMAIVLRMKYRQIFTLLLLAVISISLYFYDYSSPVHLGRFDKALFSDPLGLLEYTLLYLGSPFDVIFNRFFIMIAGIFLCLSTTKFAWQTLKTQSPLMCAIVTFIVYVIASALATAGGRVNLEVGNLLAARYTTPILMAWSLLLVLYAPQIAKQARMDWRYVLLLVWIPLLGLPIQFKAIESSSIQDEKFNREVALLALKLGINDTTQIALIGADPDAVFSIAQTALGHCERSVAIQVLMPNVDQNLDCRPPLAMTEVMDHEIMQCVGHLDKMETIETDPDYMRISGWLFNPENKTIPSMIYILNDQDLIIGYALTGQMRLEAKSAIGEAAEFSGFKGYLLSEQQQVILQSDHCRLKVQTLN